MASSIVSKICLSFFSLFLFGLTSSVLFAAYPGNKKAHDLPTIQAKRVIRAFPKHSINKPVVDGSDTVLGPQLVEKQFRFLTLGDPGPSVQEFGHHAGYYKLPHSQAARMFYLFFESRENKNDPVVIWLNGGPGCSSALSLFYENGPFHIANNFSLVWNDYGWDKASNLLFVDQPIGTGFSYTTDLNDVRHDEEGVSNDLYDFIQAFFKEHPQYAKNDFFITGESYAGHYIPAFVTRVHRGNKAKEGIYINLKGFAIGNPLTNPAIQYNAYPDYALDMKIIEQSDYNSIQRMLPKCQQSVKTCESKGGKACIDSYFTCNSVLTQIMSIAGDINYYDIRKKCVGLTCYDFSNMETFLNKKLVRDALGVGDIEFVSCSTTVYEAMQTDWMRNLGVGIPALLEDGIRVLIYAGEYDLICNWLGNSKWVHAMEWSGQKAFKAAATLPFKVDGAEAGQMKSHGPLTFLKVHDAGHMVPMDQPKASLQMLRIWMRGNVTMEQSEERISPK